MNQLRKDIDNRVEDRLGQWISDSQALYEMAGIPGKYAYAHMVYTLFNALAAALVKIGVTKGEACRMLIATMTRTELTRDRMESKAMEMGDE